MRRTEIFAGSGRAGSTFAWGDADRIPSLRWGEDTKRYSAERAEDRDGPELIQQLMVHRVGFFGVHDDPARVFAVQHKSGINIGVWLFEKYGGLMGARRLASCIAASFEP